MATSNSLLYFKEGLVKNLSGSAQEPAYSLSSPCGGLAAADLQSICHGSWEANPEKAGDSRKVRRCQCQRSMATFTPRILDSAGKRLQPERL